MPVPQPEELTQREKDDAMGGYLMMFAAFAVSLPLPVVNLIAAVVYYFINRGKSRFVHFHALQSLLSQIPTTLLNWGVLFILIRVYLLDLDAMTNLKRAYIIFAIVANIGYVIFSIVAAVRARAGRFLYFLFFGAYSFERVYAVTNTRAYENETPVDAPKPPVNKAPF